MCNEAKAISSACDPTRGRVRDTFLGVETKLIDETRVTLLYLSCQPRGGAVVNSAFGNTAVYLLNGDKSHMKNRL